jgi:hypothetical protein
MTGGAIIRHQKFVGTRDNNLIAPTRFRPEESLIGEGNYLMKLRGLLR